MLMLGRGAIAHTSAAYVMHSYSIGPDGYDMLLMTLSLI